MLIKTSDQIKVQVNRYLWQMGQVNKNLLSGYVNKNL